MKKLSVFALSATIAVAGYWFVMTTPDNSASASTDGAALVAVTVPQLTGAAKAGETAFNANCAACHGQNAAGKDGVGPPLVHKIYEPSHHGDTAFLLAARQGVRAHHWRFGNMPPVEGVSGDEVETIIAYVRELQRANGIQ